MWMVLGFLLVIGCVFGRAFYVEYRLAEEEERVFNTDPKGLRQYYDRHFNNRN